FGKMERELMKLKDELEKEKEKKMVTVQKYNRFWQPKKMECYKCGGLGHLMRDCHINKP
ncbi:hypothetical protein COBT_002426, partial [Conglomerata obtusa]